MTAATTPISIKSAYIHDDTLHFCLFPDGSSKEGWGYDWIDAFLEDHLDGSTVETAPFYRFLKAQLDDGEHATATIMPDGSVTDIEIFRHAWGTERVPNLFLFFEGLHAYPKRTDERV